MSMLSNLIDDITKSTNIYICVTDVTGILIHPDLALTDKNKYHAKKFCNIAKSEKSGFELCLRCKRICNKKAVEQKDPFFGLCPYGIFESIYPVVIEGDVALGGYINLICKKGGLKNGKKKK